MKTIIITGVSRGLGKGFLGFLISSPNKVVCVGRRLPDSSVTDKVIFLKRDMGEDFLSFRPHEIGIVEDTSEVVLINNASTIEPIASVGYFTEEEVQKSLSVNYIYPVCMINILVDFCRAANIPFRIINISTGAALSPFAGWSLYCSAKAAIRMFLDCLSRENDGVSVKHIDPGVMDTDMQETIRNASAEHFPEKDRFVKFKNEKILKSPQLAARLILEAENLL